MDLSLGHQSVHAPDATLSSTDFACFLYCYKSTMDSREALSNYVVHLGVRMTFKLCPAHPNPILWQCASLLQAAVFITSTLRTFLIPKCAFLLALLPVCLNGWSQLYQWNKPLYNNNGLFRWYSDCCWLTKEFLSITCHIDV